MIGESYVGIPHQAWSVVLHLLVQEGKIRVTIPKDYMGDLVFFCTNHSSMIQEFKVQGDTPLDDSNFHDAIALWFDAEENASAIYGHISDWNTTAVTDMSNAFKVTVQLLMKILVGGMLQCHQYEFYVFICV